MISVYYNGVIVEIIVSNVSLENA